MPWLALIAILLGHFGFWLMWFNRINATGLDRHLIKRIEKVIALLAVTIPVVIYIVAYPSIHDWLLGRTEQWLPTEPSWLWVWTIPSLATLLLAGPFWLHSRWTLRPHARMLACEQQNYDVRTEVPTSLVVHPVFAVCARLPGNQVTRLTVTRKELLLPRSVSGIDGFRIGHISDIHFTGKIAEAYYHFAMDRLLELSADLIVISGDIIDYDRCLGWIKPVLGRLSAPNGVCFVLGNHDRRLSKIEPLLDGLAKLGFIDLGASDHRTTTQAGGTIKLIGNERPWFRRHANTYAEGSGTDTESELCVAVCHSPDQIAWARRQAVDLMLAGHTHGGQIRIPGIGPLVAPSHYGSRFASGVFFLPPTLMHVSRGLCGVHPFRWFCPPEISLLTLRCPTN